VTESPAETFAALHRAADAACSARLFTVTVIDRARGLARRSYSSHTEAYPVSGTKPIFANAWTALVVDAGRPFVANTTAEFREFFPDHAAINALGCSSALNIPLSEAGAVVGTVNVLDVENHFTPERIATLVALVESHRVALLDAMAAMPPEPF
jgi:GAF domain-containing protein